MRRRKTLTGDINAISQNQLTKRKANDSGEWLSDTVVDTQHGAREATQDSLSQELRGCVRRVNNTEETTPNKRIYPET